MFFRRPHRIGRVSDVPQPRPEGEPARPPQVSCVPIAAGSINLAADLHIVQRWCFQDLAVDDLSATLALAPKETYRFKVNKTQRTKVEGKVLRSSESMVSFESSVVDKEVVNVTRTSSKSMQWEASANGQVHIGVFQAGASASVSGGMERTTENSLEQLKETTEKSSRQLKLLNKLEVGRTTETVLETEEKRTVTNPYTDRSLQLHFFELSKRYTVSNFLDPEHPFDYALILEIDDLRLDRRFVMNNQDFLEKELLDRSLWRALRKALDDSSVRPGDDRAQWFARRALKYLFDGRNVFGLEPPEPVTASEAEWNDPDQSFRGRFTRSGFSTSISNNFGDGFAAINVYYRIYQDEGGGTDEMSDETAIQLAMTLAEFVGPLWQRLSKVKKKNLLDNHDFTEVVRRLPGFLALVEGGVRPVVANRGQPASAPAESSDEGEGGDGGEDASGSEPGARAEVSEAAEHQRLSNQKADAVIARAVDHIRCNKSYYVKAFLAYVFDVTRGLALRDTLATVAQRAEDRGSALADLIDMLNPDAAYQARNHYVVPKRRDVERSDFEEVLFRVLEEAFGEVPGRARGEIQEFLGGGGFTTSTVDLPADGYFLEAVPGTPCMDDVPAGGGRVEASVDIEASGVPVSGDSGDD